MSFRRHLSHLLTFGTLLLLSCFAYGQGDPETFYKRPVTEAERAQYVIREVENFFYADRPGFGVEEIRKSYSGRKWGREVLSATLLYTSRKLNQPPYINDPGRTNLKEGIPYVRIIYLGEILYEREVTPKERERYAIRATRSFYDKGTTPEQVKRELSGRKWSADPKTIRVEVLLGGRDETPPYLTPYLQITALGEDLIRKKASTDWAAANKTRFALGRNTRTFKYFGTTFMGLEYVGGAIILENRDRLGMVTEAFQEPDGRPAGVTIYDGRTQDISTHQFLRDFITADFKVEETEFGAVVVCKYRPSPNAPAGGMVIAWPSGKHRVFYLRSTQRSPRELLPLWGKSFPSTLDKALVVDKTAWGRAEMGFWLALMKEAVSSEVVPPKYPSYGVCLSRMLTHVDIEFARKTDAHVFGAPLDKKRRVYERLASWWKEHKSTSYWDEKKRMLVGK